MGKNKSVDRRNIDKNRNTNRKKGADKNRNVKKISSQEERRKKRRKRKRICNAETGKTEYKYIESQQTGGL